MTARKARVEGAASSSPAKALLELVEAFKADHPEVWEKIRLCPLQHGIDAMAEKLNG